MKCYSKSLPPVSFQGLKSSTRSETSSTVSEEWSRVCRPGRGIVDRVRGFVDQGLKSSTRSETSSTGSEDSSTRTMNGPRLHRPCPRSGRPGVEIIDRDREFVDQDGGMLDQDDEWAMKIYRVRGMVDQKLESSTGSENSSTRTRSGRGFVDQELKSSTGSENSSTRTAEPSTRTMNGR
ncbi:unnamed protein product [Arabidopsis thaliana]|uniref:Uncharacterized protein n=1 Tax=Arabidopsis thaliana TaxID=3702 RepID=A0A5S9RV84_ARATH|nr:unnamed protein product [Arabidopsis thaliana]